MTPTPHGQVPAIQRYKIGYHSDEWGVRSLSPTGIYDDAGPWVRYEDHAAQIAALRTQQPAPATRQAGEVVAYLDIGAGGYLDLGSALSDEDLQQLPKGRHTLVIAGTYGIDGYVAAPQPSPTAQAAESVPAIQGEMNVQLDIDSNHSAPGQQRDVARSVALGQPMGHGPNQVAGHLGAQGDKLLTVAERNIRSFLRSAQFKGESDREAALNCVDVLWAAAHAPAQSVTAPSETTPHPACKSDMLVNGGALILALNVLRRAGKHEVAGELEATAQPSPTAQADSRPTPVEELDDDACRCEPSDYVRPADYDGDGSVAAMGTACRARS